MYAASKTSRILASTLARRVLVTRNIRVISAGTESLISSHLIPQSHQQKGQAFRYASSVRRRRGAAVSVQRQSGEDEDRLVRHVAVKDPDIFRQEADKLLTKLEAALRPMKKHNDVFNITLTPRNNFSNGSLTLELKPEDGMYRIEVNDEATMVHMTSAISGHYNYVLSASTGEWVDEKDGHSMEGMLVRDLIRQCNGLPDL